MTLRLEIPRLSTIILTLIHESPKSRPKYIKAGPETLVPRRGSIEAETRTLKTRLGSIEAELETLVPLLMLKM